MEIVKVCSNIGNSCLFRCMKNNYYNGKTIWITGASSGIGEELAYLLTSAGGTLILSARREDELERVKKNCNSSNVFIYPLDLGNEDSLRTTAESVLATFPAIDILFNNGGISQRGEAVETALEVDRRIFEVNFFGNILLSKMVGRQMVANKKGQIVITSSLVGKWGFYLRSSYSGSKHALHGYYESMRMEVEKSGVAISLVLPGFTQTNISKHALKGDGTASNELDSNQSSGLSPAFVAQKILNGVAKKKYEISVGRTEALGLIVRRYFPALFHRLVRKWSAR